MRVRRKEKRYENKDIILVAIANKKTAVCTRIGRELTMLILSLCRNVLFVPFKRSVAVFHLHDEYLKKKQKCST